MYSRCWLWFWKIGNIYLKLSYVGLDEMKNVSTLLIFPRTKKEFYLFDIEDDDIQSVVNDDIIYFEAHSACYSNRLIVYANCLSFVIPSI